MNSSRFLALAALAVVLSLSGDLTSELAARSSPSAKKAGKSGKQRPLVSKLYFVELELGEGFEDLARNEVFVQWLFEKVPQVAKPGTWDNNPGFVELVPIGRSGVLFVHQTPEAHAEVSAFFTSLKTSMQDFVKVKKAQQERAIGGERK